MGSREAFSFKQGPLALVGLDSPGPGLVLLWLDEPREDESDELVVKDVPVVI